MKFPVRDKKAVMPLAKPPRLNLIDRCPWLLLLTPCGVKIGLARPATAGGSDKRPCLRAGPPATVGGSDCSSINNCGSAAAHCGKAPPFRHCFFNFPRLCLRL